MTFLSLALLVLSALLVAWILIRAARQFRGADTPTGRTTSDRQPSEMPDIELDRRIAAAHAWQTAYWQLSFEAKAAKDSEFKRTAAFLRELEAEKKKRTAPARIAFEMDSILKSASLFTALQAEDAIAYSVTQWAKFDLPGNLARDGFSRNDVARRFADLREANVTAHEALERAFTDAMRGGENQASS